MNGRRKESTDAVIECMKNTFGLVILLEGVWAGETKESAIYGKDGAICSVVEFSSIIGLKSFDGGRKLRMNISIERDEKRMNFRPSRIGNVHVREGQRHRRRRHALPRPRLLRSLAHPRTQAS
jgi:hypothetical protein